MLKRVKIERQNCLWSWYWNQRWYQWDRIYVQVMSFRNRTRENDFNFSKFIWSLKDQIKEFDIQWFIIKRSSESKSCNLYLLKKLIISNFKEKERLLNKWLDLVSKCRYENKYILMNYWLTLKFIII